MAKFFVGQRVRVVHSDYVPECIGLEARVVGPLEHCLRSSGEEWDGYPIEVDGIGTRSPRGGRLVFPSSYVEPILPEGSAPSEFTFQQLMDSLQEATA